MKFAKALMVVVAAFAFAGGVMATPPGKSVEFAGGPMGKVVFDGKVHADKGFKCPDCHPKTFQMKKGADKITMASMNKGENCGVCHNGTKAPKSSDPASCKTCHKK
jgi:c(7)-type cytochrome triheme protein